MPASDSTEALRNVLAKVFCAIGVSVDDYTAMRERAVAAPREDLSAALSQWRRGSAVSVIDTTPNYTDTFPLPATPTKWKYRAIYRVGDAQVGIWSNTVEITVGG